MKGQSRSSLIRTKPSKAEWTVERAVRELRSRGTRRNVEGMARYGIRARKAFGVSKPEQDTIARKIGKNHELGLRLWRTGIHDARILGILISDSQKVTGAQMERWVKDFDNWDVCDGACCHLFVDAEPAWEKALVWSGRTKEFEKRAGFALTAYLAVHDKKAGNAEFWKFLKVIEREAWDQRNFVRKAANWALRNIGKRNLELNRAAIACAERIRKQDHPAAKWIAADALRELKGEAVQQRLRQKSARI